MIKRQIIPMTFALVLVSFPFFFSMGSAWTNGLYQYAHNDLVLAIPYLFLSAIAFMTYQMNMRRMFFVCLYLAVSCLCLNQLAIHAGSPLFLIAAPITLGALLFWPEARLFGRDGGVLLGFAFLPSFILWAMQKWLPMASLHFYGFHFFEPWHLISVPQISLAFYAFFVLAIFLQDDRYLKRIHGYLALGLLPLYYVLEVKGLNPIDVTVAFGACAFLLLICTLTIYWQKIYMDELTGVPNRRALNEALTRLSGNYTIAMIDIDHFKKFNDTYGHEEGDNVLKLVGQHVFTGSGGRAYRYGGEEFTMLFQGKLPDEVFDLVDGIRKSLSETSFKLRAKARRNPLLIFMRLRKKTEEGPSVKVTISIGLATILKAADECLYKAKEQGRNCTVVAQGHSSKKAS